MHEDTMNAKSNPSAQVTAVINQLAPVGTIVAYGGNATTLPPGWLLCDRAPFDQTKYPDLYAALGNTNILPDLRGYFLRGLDPSGSVDPNGSGRKVLSPQGDPFGKHSHTTLETPWFWNEATAGGQYIVGTNTTNGLHAQ